MNRYLIHQQYERERIEQQIQMFHFTLACQLVPSPMLVCDFAYLVRYGGSRELSFLVLIAGEGGSIHIRARALPESVDREASITKTNWLLCWGGHRRRHTKHSKEATVWGRRKFPISGIYW